MDPTFLALSRLKRRRFEQCIEGCTELLIQNPLDQGKRTETDRVSHYPQEQWGNYVMRDADFVVVKTRLEPPLKQRL